MKKTKAILVLLIMFQMAIGQQTDKVYRYDYDNSGNRTGQYMEDTRLKITTQPSARQVCYGSSTNFSVVATSNGTLSYQWRRNGDDISGATSSSYTVPAANENTEGDYRCVVSCYKDGTTTRLPSVPAKLSYSRLDFTVQPQSSNFCVGNSVTLSVATNGSSPSYQWIKDGSNVSGAHSSSLSLSNLTYLNAGFYSCLVTTGGCSFSSAQASLYLIQGNVNGYTSSSCGSYLTSVPVNCAFYANSNTGSINGWEVTVGSSASYNSYASNSFSYTFTESGTYYIRAIMSDCSYTDPFSLTIDAGPQWTSNKPDTNGQEDTKTKIITAEPGQNLVKVTPNPNDGNFKLYLLSQYQGEVLIRIRNVSGQAVKVIKIVKNTDEYIQEESLVGISRGIYFIEVTQGKHVTVVKMSIQ